MRQFIILLVSMTLVSCYKPILLQNQIATQKNIPVCLLLGKQQPNNHYIWSYDAFYPNDKTDISFYFNLSDFLPISDSCQYPYAVLQAIDVADHYFSTSGPKGESVTEFRITAEVSFNTKESHQTNKELTLNARTKEYNWAFQKTIINMEEQAFSQGMNKLYEEIVKHMAVL